MSDTTKQLLLLMLGLGIGSIYAFGMDAFVKWNNSRKPKFLVKGPGFFRIGKLELYLIKGKPEFGISRGPCNCLIIDLGFIGITFISAKYECYLKADEKETN